MSQGRYIASPPSKFLILKGTNKVPEALSPPYEAALGPRGRAGGKGGAGLGAKLLTVVIDREGRQG